uniref:Chitin-binding type-2 domain-containing protein n=1 Tax=Anopheles farauti TaxID=69004 RepID=A0A182QPD8_9DIPT
MLGNEFTLLLAVLAAVSAATIDPRCTRYSFGMEAQVLSYQPDCRKFVICDMGGNGQVLSCPPGLYFSDESHACSFDTSVCTHGELIGTIHEVPSRPELAVPSQPVPSQPMPKPPQPLPPLPVVPVQPQPPVLVPEIHPMPIPNEPERDVSSADETSVEEDVHRLPIITAAPTTVASVEDHPEAGQLPQQSVCWNKPAGNVYPVVNDCGLYVVCFGDNNAIVQRCPKGLLYDHKQQRCEFAEASYCATPRIDGHVMLDVHGVDMTLYGDGIPVVAPIQEGAPALAIDMVEQHEHQPVLVVPAEPEVHPAPEVEYSFRIIDNHPRCLARNNLALTVELPHDTDCSKYYVCVGRVAFEKQCPAGQHWNAKNNWCDFTSQANCTL